MVAAVQVEVEFVELRFGVALSRDFEPDLCSGHRGVRLGAHEPIVTGPVLGGGAADGEFRLGGRSLKILTRGGEASCVAVSRPHPHEFKIGENGRRPGPHCEEDQFEAGLIHVAGHQDTK